MLPEDHWLKAELIAKAAEVLEPVGKIRDVKKNFVQVTGESLSGHYRIRYPDVGWQGAAGSADEAAGLL